MPEFVIQSGKHAGKKLRLPSPEILIGRDESCVIRLTSRDVSRYHCRIRRTESGWTVRDLGSSNGTFVNDVEIQQEQELKPGDAIRTGPLILQFKGESTAADRRKKKQTQTKGESGLSDDDIVSLLAGDSPSTTTPGDTAILSKAVTPPQTVREDADSGKSDATCNRSGAAKQFDSIAEEAADIIRRHWEMVRQEEEG